MFFSSSKTTSFQYLDVGSLHAGGSGLDNTGALELAECIYDHGAGDPHTVRDLAGYQDSLVAIQFLKNMGNGFQLGEGQGADG